MEVIRFYLGLEVSRDPPFMLSLLQDLLLLDMGSLGDRCVVIPEVSDAH